jgi:tetratricopeptide (TPR) repeat protein
MSRKNAVSFFLLIAAAACLMLSSPLAASPAAGDRESVVKIIQQIQKADYEADRPALHRLYEELAPFAEKKDLAVRIQYWRGFALWRSAINGFNDNAPKQEIQQDLNQAVDAFEKSLAADPAFVDSKIAIASCLGFLAYSFERGSPLGQEHIARIRLALKDAQATAPDNPRLLWVLGPVYWNIPAERGGGQAKAMDTYEKGLEIIRSHKATTSDSLDPVWGEPELLMSLAWSNLNRTTPDVKAAEQNAQAALALVPNWHYVRDILMHQILDAKAKQSGTS